MFFISYTELTFPEIKIVQERIVNNTGNVTFYVINF